MNPESNGNLRIDLPVTSAVPGAAATSAIPDATAAPSAPAVPATAQAATAVAEAVEPPKTESQIPLPDRQPVHVPESKTSTLAKRLLSGAVYVLLSAGAILWCPLATAALVSIISVICCWEFFRIMRADAKLPNQMLGLSFAAVIPFVSLSNGVYVLAFVFFMVLCLGVWYVLNLRARITDLAVTLFGTVYTSMMFSTLVLIRDAAPHGWPGAFLTLGVLCSIWAADSFAFLAGNAFGKHALVPKISPKKSWEGLVGGMLGSLVIWCVLSFIPGVDMSPTVSITGGLAVGITAVLGDLVESRIKRGAGIKDSGRIMPGHGGLLDRCDSILFASVTAYFVLRITGVL